MTRPVASWRCPVCGGGDGSRSWTVAANLTEGGVDPELFRPSSDAFGHLAAPVVRCATCGHGSVEVAPPATTVDAAYGAAADPVSLREEPGQLATASRALAELERLVSPGRLLDVGCWTGSLLVAAAARGWSVTGVEPSGWAAAEATRRGVEVHNTTFGAARIPPGSCRAVVLCDVLEHLADPGSALRLAHGALEPGGACYVTLPDAGSPLARLLGRRWWSVMPMHLQYFTRSSAARLLAAQGFEVRRVTSHAKVFTVRYYAERLGGYHPGLERLVTRLLARAAVADRLVAPDLHDRMAILALRRS